MSPLFSYLRLPVFKRIQKFTLPCKQISYTRSLLSKDDSMVTPWYVTEARKNIEENEQNSKLDFPELPVDSPSSLTKIVEYAIRDMGLRDVTVIDKRAEDELITSALGPSIIVLGTGSSTRHLGSAGSSLLSWLKKEFGVFAGREGILTTNFIKLQSRRQKRRQQRQRMASETASPLQKVGPWIAIDTKLDNIYVHLMTAERRNEIDLEHLGLLGEEGDMVSADLLDMEDEFMDPTSNGVTASSTPSSAPSSSTHTAASNTKSKSLGRKNYSTTSSGSTPTPSTREELALENLILEKRDDITEDSPEVQDFVALFPAFPERDDWKRRLDFFAISAIQSPLFSLKRVISEAELQQASGFLLDDEDIETLVSSICYHGQSHFAELAVSDESSALWKELCDYKAQILIELYDLAFRPTGKTMLGNPRLLVLLYRTFTGMSNSSTTPSAVMINPSPETLDLEVFFDAERLHPLRYLLETTEEIRNVQTVAMILTSLANHKLFDAFWKVVDLATLSCASRDISENIAEIAVSLMVKSGDSEQITFAIQTYIPESILKRNVRLTPALVQAMEAGLESVDVSKSSFTSVRSILSQYRDSVPHLS